MDKIPIDQISEDKMEDNTLYCVFRASARYITEEMLLKQIVYQFNMENNDNVYILPATSIKRPLIVIRDFGTKDSLSRLHVLPKRDWGRIFKQKIIDMMNKGK